MSSTPASAFASREASTRRSRARETRGPAGRPRFRTLLASSSGKGDVDERIEFGKPSAPEEMYQRYAGEARTSLLKCMKEENLDALAAGLHVAAEDDAVKTRSVVQLPVESYLKRRDQMAEEFVRFYLPEERDPGMILEALENYVFVTMKYRAAVDDLETFSSYRTYAHHVLAQKCGNGVGLAIVLAGMVHKLREGGVIDFETSYLVPGYRGTPKLVPGPGERMWVHGFSSASSCFLRPVSEKTLVLMLLESLKRFFWPWEWPSERPGGFLPAAEAAVSNSRVGTVAAGTGIIQASGRAFGDLERALLSTERLVECGSSDVQIMDQGVLLYHLKRYEESYRTFRELAGTSIQEGSADVPSRRILGAFDGPDRERETLLLRDMMSRLPLLIAESKWPESGT